MGLVDIGGIAPQFFVTTVFFLLFIFGAISLGILRLFQQRVRFGLISIIVGAVGIAAYVIVLNRWLI
ncbi:hypothetical protein [Paenibacillus koleovorans]|uniref:hypothetical protein n=1 Tax=Paenibacillus koleovorans TaxID=121608 RepID=UPI000FDB3B8C|nr:hypothetical protein [Paenibacillus koleovorans]